MIEERGQKVIYGKANKALYSTLNASLLFLKDLTSTIGGRKFDNNNDVFILNLSNYILNSVIMISSLPWFLLLDRPLEEIPEQSPSRILAW